MPRPTSTRRSLLGLWTESTPTPAPEGPWRPRLHPTAPPPRALLAAALLGLTAACSTKSTKEDPHGDSGATTGDGGSGETLGLGPTALDFGTIAVAATATETLTLTNPGDTPLTLASPTLSGASTFSVVLADPDAELELAPGASLDLVVSYSADDETADSATLSVAYADTEHVVTLRGSGAYGTPLAAIVCPASTEVDTPVSLDGTASTSGVEPGGALRYVWSVAAPAPAGRSEIAEVSAGLAEFSPDVPGTWTLGLEVIDDANRVSTLDTCEVEVLTGAPLYIQLTWDTDEVDLDLHLTEGDAQPFDASGSCNYCNRYPDWGAEGATDDPVLVQDNRTGYGPEAIYVAAPDRVEATVWAYHQSADPTRATLRVWLDDVLTVEESVELDSAEMWLAGTLSWSDGVFTPSALAPERWTGERTCPPDA